MNKKTKSSIVLTSLAAIGVATSLLVGSTYALFTSESKTNIAVTSGKVEVVATIDESSLTTFSGVDLEGNVEADADKIKPTADLDGGTNGKFITGGSASIVDGTLKLDEMVPGDKVTFNINVKNNSTVAVKYCTVISCDIDDDLFNGLKFKIGSESFDGRTSFSVWKTLTSSQNGNVTSLPCEVNLPSDAGNDYQGGKSCTVSYTVKAVQGNAYTSDPSDDVIEVYNVSDLKWVQKHNSEIDATKTVKLMNNLDLSGINWTPIGNSTAKPFVATFDGNDKTISNLTTTQYSYRRIENNCGYGTGLFAYVKDATIKNLVIDGANVGGETAVDGANMYSEVGIVAGCTYGNSTFDKITVKNSTVKAQTKVGAIVGQSITSGSTTKITNCTITNVTVSGNYSYAIVCGLVNAKASILDLTGTNVTGSSASFWTSDSCDFKNGSTSVTYSQVWGDGTSYKWEAFGSTFYIIEVANAWAVQRGDKPEVTGSDDSTGNLLESIVYVGVDSTRTFPLV